METAMHTSVNNRIFQLFLIVSICVFTAQLSIAGGGAIQSMANIMMKINHYPSDSEKKTLGDIVNDKSTSEHDRVMAQSIINLQHKASPADKEKLSKIMNDKSAPADARDLASIIHNLNHTPSEGDKARLEKMIH